MKRILLAYGLIFALCLPVQGANIWLSKSGEIGAGHTPQTTVGSLPTVDGRDLLAWQRGYGSADGATPADGDANFDGTVDDSDLAVWQSQYSGNFSLLEDYAGIGGGLFQEGDMNLDDIIDLMDIDAFALALISPAEYRAIYGINPGEAGDIDDDGDLDVDDIDDFVELLGLAGIAGLTEELNAHWVAVPEPSTLILTLVGFGSAGRRRLKNSQVN